MRRTEGKQESECVLSMEQLSLSHSHTHTHTGRKGPSRNRLAHQGRGESLTVRMLMGEKIAPLPPPLLTPHPPLVRAGPSTPE